MEFAAQIPVTVFCIIANTIVPQRIGIGPGCHDLLPLDLIVADQRESLRGRGPIDLHHLDAISHSGRARTTGIAHGDADWGRAKLGGPLDNQQIARSAIGSQYRIEREDTAVADEAAVELNKVAEEADAAEQTAEESADVADEAAAAEK